MLNTIPYIYDIMNFLRSILKLIHNCPEHIFYTSFVIFHKFYWKSRTLCYDEYLVGTACLFLASKIEESPIVLAELATAYHKTKVSAAEPSAQQAIQIQNSLSAIESHILREIGASLIIELPYKYIQEYKNYPEVNMAKIVQIASYFCNDSFLLPLSLYYHPMQIACSCIYFSTLYLKSPLPEFKGHAWYKFLHPIIEFNHVQEVANFIKLIYKKMDEQKKEIGQCEHK